VDRLTLKMVPGFDQVFNLNFIAPRKLSPGQYELIATFNVKSLGIGPVSPLDAGSFAYGVPVTTPVPTQDLGGLI
jgi:hypothetical protein